MSADDPTPLTIGRVPPQNRPGELTKPGDSAEPIGRSVAGMLRHLIAVLDREDRLESGTGEWLTEFRTGGDARIASVREGVLRALRLAGDGTNFRILEELAVSESVTRSRLAERLGLTELSVSERVGDLVSAGLAVKVSEANQITGTSAGLALTEWVHRAAAAGAATLDGDL